VPIPALLVFRKKNYFYPMEHDTPFVHLRIKDNILIVSYRRNLIINLDVAHKIVLYRQSFSRGKKFAAIILSQGVTSIDKPAREYLASEEGTEGLFASAIIVNSAFSRFMGNFFMRVNKTSIPVKLFSNISQAKKWLQQFISNQSNGYG
jgi:hypothetical protein